MLSIFKKPTPDYFIATYAIPKDGTPVWSMPHAHIRPYSLAPIYGKTTDEAIIAMITNKQFFIGEEEISPSDILYPQLTSAQYVKLISGESTSEFGFYGFMVTARSLQLSFYQISNPSHRHVITLGQAYREIEYDFEFATPSHRFQSPGQSWQVEQDSRIRVLLTCIYVEPASRLERLVYRSYTDYQTHISERYYNLVTGKPEGNSYRHELSECQYAPLFRKPH